MAPELEGNIMYRKILVVAMVVLLTFALAAAQDGPISAKVYSGTTAGVKVPIYPIILGVDQFTPDVVSHVSCLDQNFQVLAWAYDGYDFNLVFPAVADSSSMGFLAGSYVPITGNYDFLVVKTAAAADISHSLYRE